MRQVLERLGWRAAVRATPRLGIALAAAGCAIAVLGALTIGGDELAGDGEAGSRFPGTLLSAAVTIGGVALMAVQRRGPLATAGSVAAATGVPPFLFFVTFDDGSSPPVSIDLILLVSTGAWAVAYLVGPGRGRPFFLGAACVGLWVSVLEIVESAVTQPFEFFSPIPLDDPVFGTATDAVDLQTIAIISLLFGAGYLTLARWWDRLGYQGAATAPTAAALIALPVGVSFLADDLDATAAGLAAVLVGFAVALHGATVGRRATTWLGAFGVVVGVLAIVTDTVDEATPAGIVLMATGAGVVLAAEALRRVMGEPDEFVAQADLSGDVPSGF